MDNKELAVELTKTYMDSYIRGVFSDQNATLSSKTGSISPEKFERAYQKFYSMLSNRPNEK